MPKSLAIWVKLLPLFSTRLTASRLNSGVISSCCLARDSGTSLNEVRHLGSFLFPIYRGKVTTLWKNFCEYSYPLFAPLAKIMVDLIFSAKQGVSIFVPYSLKYFCRETLIYYVKLKLYSGLQTGKPKKRVMFDEPKKHFTINQGEYFTFPFYSI